MLIFDVLDDRIPASIVVDLITVAWRVDDIESETDSILLDDCNLLSVIHLGRGSRITYYEKRSGSLWSLAPARRGSDGPWNQSSAMRRLC